MSKAQIITNDEGQPEYAVVPIADYQRLLDVAEEKADIQAYDEAMEDLALGDDELIPHDMLKRLVDGKEHPLKIWREYRSMTQGALADATGVTKAYVSSIENGKQDGSLAVLKAFTAALKVDLDDIA
jgi:DNA-binding XRE family transcriptional regulator